MKKLWRSIRYAALRLYSFSARSDGFGMNELLGTAAALIIAAFVIIPGLREFAEAVMLKLNDWWAKTVVDEIFQSRTP